MLRQVYTYEVRCDGTPTCFRKARVESIKDVWGVMGELAHEGWMYSAPLDTVLCPDCAEKVRTGKLARTPVGQADHDV